MDKLAEIQNLLRKQANIPPERQAIFFKTNPGDYAAHDRFIGVNTPTLRTIAKTYCELSLPELQGLLASPINEERSLALIILVNQYQKADNVIKEKIYQFYVSNLAHINNWNLVDISAHLIVGAYLWDKDKSPLLTWAKSNNLWERRVAIVSTWYFIRKNELKWTFKISEYLLNDKEDLIHKAAGWMLREAGKRDVKALTQFLDQHATRTPRTMLRYALEKFPEDQRQFYLQQKNRA